PAFIVALCDAALMHCHPAHLFFNAVERMKEHHWTPAGIDSVYAFVFDGLDLDWRGHADTFQSLHKRTVATAANEFRDALKADVFKENVRWFEQVMAGALKLRTEHGGFFAKLVSSPGMLSQLFYEVFDEMGTPFMTNALFNGYFYPPKKLKAASIQPYLPWVFLSIRMTFRGGKKCLLHSFCQARPDKRVTDQNCENSPWERVRLPELCPYAQMWKTWGLTGKQPV
ncbi:MAG TPA: hypothetical protein VGR14_10875, partial [Verrucomicrobiae bacterium]|nr:hypothetical protein [Verrucomicrobiae bacterium]